MFYWMDFEVDYNRISFRIVLAMTKIENTVKLLIRLAGLNIFLRLKMQLLLEFGSY